MSLVLCWLWFVGSPGLLPKRPGGILNLHARYMAIGAIMSMPVLFIGSQLMQRAIERPRPLHVEGLLTIPVPPQLWQEVMASFPPATAFPSDHAIVIGLLLSCVWRISRLMSMAVGSILFIPLVLRIALGFHWPSDVLAGLMIGGISGMMIALSMPYQLTTAQRINRWLQCHPDWMHVGLFLFLYDFSQKFSWLFSIGDQLLSWL